eukprot:COSAG05_NODE_15445_length_369_cov_0.951852_1_plen_32_part_10
MVVLLLRGARRGALRCARALTCRVLNFQFSDN